jgi:hypothetical protein
MRSRAVLRGPDAPHPAELRFRHLCAHRTHVSRLRRSVRVTVSGNGSAADSLAGVLRRRRGDCQGAMHRIVHHESMRRPCQRNRLSPSEGTTPPAVPASAQFESRLDAKRTNARGSATSQRRRRTLYYDADSRYGERCFSLACRSTIPVRLTTPRLSAHLVAHYSGIFLPMQRMIDSWSTRHRR